VQANARVLSRFCPLTQMTPADVLKNVVAHFGPPKIGRNLVKTLLGAQMTGQRSVVKVMKQHGPEEGRDHPSSPFRPLRKETHQTLMHLEVPFRSLTGDDFPSKVFTKRISALMFL
jgi:hypothetical protein